jgi:hypothetical protein
VIQKGSDDNQAARVLKKELAQWSDDWKQQAMRDG